MLSKPSKAAPTARHSARRPAILDLRVPNPSRIHQGESQNPSSWIPKFTKLGSKIKKNQSWEVSGRILEPSWPQDPPKTKIELQKPFLGALLGIHLGGQNPPKSNKNRSWIALGNLSDIEVEKWWQKSPKILFKILSKFIQNQSKIDHFFDHVLWLPKK